MISSGQLNLHLCHLRLTDKIYKEMKNCPYNTILCVTAGLLESSMRLKPHEAQSYRKKALWVSWISIVVTLILAVAAFSKHLKYTF